MIMIMTNTLLLLEFNTMAASTFNARLAAQTDLIRKPEFDAKLKALVIELLKIRLNTYL